LQARPPIVILFPALLVRALQGLALPALLLLKKDSEAGFAQIRLPVTLSILRLPRFAAAFLPVAVAQEPVAETAPQSKG
jgi:hypothetical protein